MLFYRAQSLQNYEIKRILCYLGFCYNIPSNQFSVVC